MPDATFQLEVVTPERLALRVAATEASIPALLGCIGMRPGHAQLVAELGAGELTWKPAGTAEPVSAADQTPLLVLGGGFVEITNEKAVILADSAEWPGEIDPARALAALERPGGRAQRGSQRGSPGRSAGRAARAGPPRRPRAVHANPPALKGNIAGAVARPRLRKKQRLDGSAGILPARSPRPAYGLVS